MNNLKRVLSLALASVMLIGMMAVGASAADFTDADKIEYANAVEILVALKVINGKDDGSFDPQGNVTRGEMAKMISVAMNGGNEANTGTKGVPTYTDISGHWAESYIEYCSDLGIISGRGDGTFAPNDNVTGLEATKMVLTALGYDAQAYKLTGASWAVRTDELARQGKPSLYDNLAGVIMANNASREVAAQVIWNGLQNRTKVVTPSTNTSNGEVTWQYNNGADTLLGDRYEGKIWIGTYIGNDKNTTVAKKGEIVVNGRIDGSATVDADGNAIAGTNANFPSDMGIENIGEEVKVIFKDGGNGNVKGKPDAKDTIYGVFNTGATQVIKTTLADIKDNFSTEAQLNIGGVKYDVATTGVSIYKNYTAAADRTFPEGEVKGTASGGNTSGTNSALTAYLQGNGNTCGDPVKFVCNGDGAIYRGYIEESYLGVVTAISGNKITISSTANAVGTLEIDKNDVYEGVAKDDVVSVTTLYYDGGRINAQNAKAFNIIKKAERVSGTVDSYRGTEAVVLDGTSYEIYKHTGAMQTASLSNSVASFSGENVGQDFDLYLINGFVAAAVQTSQGNSNYSVIVGRDINGDIGSTLNGVKIEVLGADGVRSILTVSKDSKYRTNSKTGTTRTLNKNELTVGSIVTYTINRSGDAEVVVEKNGTEAAADGEVKYKKDTKTLVVNGTTYTVASNAALFGYVENDATKVSENFKAYTLRSMGDNEIKEGNMYTVVLDKEDVVKAVYMDQKEKPAGATDNTVYGIVTTKASSVKIDGSDYVQYQVGVNEETYTVNITPAYNDDLAADEVTPLMRGAIVKLDPTADNIYTATEFKVVKATDANTVMGYSKEYNETDGTITLFCGVTPDGDINVGTNPATYAVAKDCNFFYVDQDADKGTLGAIGAFDPIRANTTINIIVILDKDEAICDVIYETSNAFNILNAAG